MKISAFIERIDKAAPFRYAMDFDNAGFLVGDLEKEITKVLLCLDVTKQALDKAEKIGANLIVRHHPLIFHPVKTVIKGEYVSDMIMGLIEKGIAVLSAHTNFDVANPGVNDQLAQRIGLSSLSVLDPYEEKNEEGAPFGLGRVGEIAPCTPEELAKIVKKGLGIPHVRMVCGKSPITKVAVSGGSCGEYFALAKEIGCDAFVTAEIKHDQYIAAAHLGLTMIDAGHYASEYWGLLVLEEVVKKMGITVTRMPFEEIPMTV